MPRAHASYHGSAWVFRQDHHKRVIVSKRRFPSAAAWNSCHKSFTVESLKKEIYIYLDQDKIQASLDRDIAPLKPDDQSKLSNGTIQEGVVWDKDGPVSSPTMSTLPDVANICIEFCYDGFLCTFLWHFEATYIAGKGRRGPLPRGIDDRDQCCHYSLCLTCDALSWTGFLLDNHIHISDVILLVAYLRSIPHTGLLLSIRYWIMSTTDSGILSTGLPRIPKMHLKLSNSRRNQTIRAMRTCSGSGKLLGGVERFNNESEITGDVLRNQEPRRAGAGNRQHWASDRKNIASILQGDRLALCCVSTAKWKLNGPRSGCNTRAYLDVPWQQLSPDLLGQTRERDTRHESITRFFQHKECGQTAYDLHGDVPYDISWIPWFNTDMVRDVVLQIWSSRFRNRKHTGSRFIYSLLCPWHRLSMYAGCGLSPYLAQQAATVLWHLWKWPELRSIYNGPNGSRTTLVRGHVVASGILMCPLWHCMSTHSV